MKQIRIIPLALLLLLTAASCRQANTQTTTFVQQADPQQWTRDLPLPAPITDRPEQILTRKAYVVSYNRDTRQPNWVAWRLTLSLIHI